MSNTFFFTNITVLRTFCISHDRRATNINGALHLGMQIGYYRATNIAVLRTWDCFIASVIPFYKYQRCYAPFASRMIDRLATNIDGAIHVGVTGMVIVNDNTWN